MTSTENGTYVNQKNQIKKWIKRDDDVVVPKVNEASPYKNYFEMDSSNEQKAPSRKPHKTSTSKGKAPVERVAPSDVERQREEWKQKREAREKEAERANEARRKAKSLPNEKKKEHKKSKDARERKTATDDSKDKSGMMYSLWQSNQKASDKAPSSHKILSCAPTLVDLNAVVFLPNSEFQVGEVVLAPRTRGGFSYAKITQQLQRTQCFFDPMVEHELNTWRVVYNSNGKSLYKDLPAPYIGKLPDGPHVSERFVNDTLEAEASEGEAQKILGEKSSIKDLQTVVFSPQCTFKPDELVLVPRSAGGFTYGKIYKESKQNCKLAIKDSHPLNAWKVIVSKEDNPNNVSRKELCVACIGKITLWNEVIRIPKSRHAIFAECEEIPNPELAAKKESEILEQEERAASLSDKSGEEKTPTDDESFLDDVVQMTEGMNELPELKLISMPTKPQPVPAPEPVAPQPVTTSSPPNPAPLQIGGIIAVDKQDLLKKLMTTKKEKAHVDNGKKHLIIIDGPNVARKHGKDVEFSTEGLSIALKYWNDKGHDAIAFLPEHYVKRKPGQGTVTLQEYLPKAKNIPLIMDLIDKGKVVLTPPQDYDDSYTIDYAMKHDGCIVSNDRYWDHIEKKADLGKKAKKETLKWIREHLISFTFVRDEFMPNPNFKFPPFKEAEEV